MASRIAAHGPRGPDFPNWRQRHKALPPRAGAGVASDSLGKSARGNNAGAIKSNERKTTKQLMKNPTPYLKMRVLGAIDMAPGNTIRDRIKAVSQMTFTDEQGNPRQFTWRTIQTWYYRYQKHGVTVMENKTRSDKGKTRKVSLEDVLEAIDAILPHVHGAPKRAVLYRLCIEQGLLIRSQVAPNTFSRLIRQFDMLKPQADSDNKQRLAFSMKHANDMWQADTMFGPSLRLNGASVPTRLIAFIDDASRVFCHGEFFFGENVDTLVEAIRAAFYKRGVPEPLRR